MKLITSILAILTATSLAQGPLAPPGAPAPTMKTLDEIHSKVGDAGEKRTPISSLPFTISTSGSYYFTGNLSFSAAAGDAITITASHVTVDLCGFTLSSTAGVTGSGIVCPLGPVGLTVRNGKITGTTTVTISGVFPNRTWSAAAGGFAYGINSQSGNAIFEQLQVDGCRSGGLNSPVIGCALRQVTASNNGGIGIYLESGGSVTNSTASRNTSTGIFAPSSSVANFSAVSNGGYGIIADSGGSVTNSAASSNGNSGMSVQSGSVTNSAANSNQLEGILGSDSSVTNCTAQFNGGIGIIASNASVTNSTARNNTGVNLYARDSVVAFCKYTTGDTLGSALTGNLTP